MRLGVVFGLVALFVLARPAMPCSECMCGTPFPADVLGGVVPMRLAWGFEERYLSKSNALDEAPGQEQEREHRVAAFALWRPLNRLALLARLPYAVKNLTSRPLAGPETIDRARGLGDAELLAMVGVAHLRGPHPLSVALVGGGTAPTGANDLRDDAGQRLDAHLQSGVGAWSGTGGVNLAMPAGSGVLEASVLGRASGASAHGYRYGNVLLYNAGFTSQGWNGLRLLLQVNGRAAARDRLEDGTLGENTGGSVLYAAPGLRWVTAPGLSVETALQIPVTQALYGVQAEHATARLSLSVSH
jgi:hypothetical protein